MVESENALEASIRNKPSMSYYYAHSRKYDCPEEAKVMEGHGIITGGPPVLIETNAEIARPAARTEKISRYTWFDDNNKVKVIIEFDF